jgi:hypothetical protein
MVRNVLFWAIPGATGEAHIKSLSLILRRLDEIDDCIWKSYGPLPSAIRYGVAIFHGSLTACATS